MSPAHPHRRDSPDIVALGEGLVEFSQTDDTEGRLYRQSAGGDICIFAIAASRQGARVACAGALGHDIHGEMLRDLWDREGIDHTAVRTDPDAPTGICFVVPDERGHRLHEFRSGSAASRIRPKDLPRALLGRTKVLHLSGITLGLGTSACDTGFAAIDLAHDLGVRVSFDTNLRRHLWPVTRARAVIREALRLCQIALPSYDDMVAITELERPEAMVDHCLELGAQVVALKLGVRGAIVANAAERHHLRVHPGRPLDTTGAGDVFGGAFVARLLAGDSLLAAGRYAIVAAGLATQGHGAVEPIPRAVAVRKALRP